MKNHGAGFIDHTKAASSRLNAELILFAAERPAGPTPEALVEWRRRNAFAVDRITRSDDARHLKTTLSGIEER
jgi:hypothetical protein